MAVHASMADTESKSSPSVFCMVMQAPAMFHAKLCRLDGSCVFWDSGASKSITPSKHDFAGPIDKPSFFTKLSGLAKGLRIQGEGQVLWPVRDVNDNLRLIKLPAYYVPKAGIRLLSTTNILNVY